MASKWSNLAGTVLGYFRLGLTGVRLKNSSGNLLLRNSDDSADAVLLPQSLGTGTRDGTKFLRDDGSWQAGGSLTYFSESRNTSAPNATIPAHIFSAIGTETNIDLVLFSKGTGAIIASVPDNTSTGGNKRGTYAIDLQQSRAFNDQVAQASYSVISGGRNNKISVGSQYAAVLSGLGNGIVEGDGGSGTYSLICGGNVNYINYNTPAADSIASTVVGGQSNAINLCSYSFIGGGSNNTVSNSAYASIIGGSHNTISNGSIGASILGGRYGAAKTKGQQVCGFESDTSGRYQNTVTGLRQSTTNTTSVATTDASSVSTVNQLLLANNSALSFEGKVIARDTSTNDCKAWSFKGLIKRGANAAATSIVGQPVVDVVAQDTNAAAWTIALSADTTNGALSVSVTSTGANAVRWQVTINSAEVA